MPRLLRLPHVFTLFSELELRSEKPHYVREAQQIAMIRRSSNWIHLSLVSPYEAF